MMEDLEHELEATLRALRRSAEHLRCLEQYNAQQVVALTAYQRRTLAMAHSMVGSRSSGTTTAAATAASISQAFVAQQRHHDELDEACHARVVALHGERMRELWNEATEIAPEQADVRDVERLSAELGSLLEEQARLEELAADVDAKHHELRSRRVALEERIRTLRAGTSAATHLSVGVLQRQLR